MFFFFVLVFDVSLKYIWGFHLLPAVRRKVKSEDGEEGDAHTGYDQVDGVEKRLATHGDVESNVEVRLITACVELLIPLGRHLENVPLDRHVKLRQVYAQVHHCRAFRLVQVPKIDLTVRSFFPGKDTTPNANQNNTLVHYTRSCYTNRHHWTKQNNNNNWCLIVAWSRVIQELFFLHLCMMNWQSPQLIKIFISPAIVWQSSRFLLQFRSLSGSIYLTKKHVPSAGVLGEEN